jgi:hypothetical protein
MRNTRGNDLNHFPWKPLETHCTGGTARQMVFLLPYFRCRAAAGADMDGLNIRAAHLWRQVQGTTDDIELKASLLARAAALVNHIIEVLRFRNLLLHSENPRLGRAGGLTAYLH